MNWITSIEAWIALFTLTSLEIILGIDNIIMLSILVGKLPQKDKQLARLLGLSFSMITRLALLFSLVWMIHLTKPLITIFNFELTGRDLILSLGGLFLIAKSTTIGSMKYVIMAKKRVSPEIIRGNRIPFLLPS